MLQENLRKALLVRIERGQLTGLGLAQMTGFKQAHISNFVRGKSALSLEGMDRVLAVQQMSVLDLIDPLEINKRATFLPRNRDEFVDVPVIKYVVAANPLIANRQVKQTIQIHQGFIERLGYETEGERKRWGRFIALRVSAHDGWRMYPRLRPHAMVLVDRHYNSLKPYRRGEANIYAVRHGKSCVLTYVEMVEGRMLLRPHDSNLPVTVLRRKNGRRCSDYILGRICYAQTEC